MKKQYKMDETLKNKIDEAIAIAKSLFDRGKTSGSSANLSFRHDNSVYVTASGTSFGSLTVSSFAKISLDGTLISGPKPSKEFPLHLSLYKNDTANQAVIHTHSFYATLWSCLQSLNDEDAIPSYTPYLRMQTGNVRLIDYHKPGSNALFDAFDQRLTNGRSYLLKNHGPIVAGDSLTQAFYVIEELEESCRIAWHLKDTNARKIIF